jgi:hypothetical protein
MNLTAHIETFNKPAVVTDSNGSMSIYAEVFVVIIDPYTGGPTNGNNCVVTYNVNENGNIHTETVTVPGMRSLIYDNEIGHVTFDSSRQVVFTTSKTFSIVSVKGGTDVLPPPPALPGDIEISDIKVDSETAPGANNGQITVTATATYLPVGYTLDGSGAQASPTFSGLAGGSHTVTVVDANGQQVNQTVFVPTVNSLLKSDPSVTLPGGNISRWNAAFNPIVFSYQRKDFNVTKLEQHTVNGNTRVFVKEDVSAVSPGDMVYLETGTCTGTFNVTEKYNQALVIDTPFTANSTGFININKLRPYYKISTRITFYDIINGKEHTIIATNRPNNQGITRADLANFLQSLLRVRDQSDYTQSNYRDNNLSAWYKVSYAEEWDGHTPIFNTIEYPFYVLYAAKQLGERYGGNLAAYVPFSITPAGADKAGWITDFTEPAYSIGYPFDIGFIYGEDLIGRELYAEFVLLDINRKPLPGGGQTSYLLNDDESWLLNQDGSKMVIAGQGQQEASVAIPAQLGLNRLLIQGDFASDVYFINATLKYDDTDATHAVTKTQTIRVDDAVDDQSVYLRWIGLSGSDAQTRINEIRLRVLEGEVAVLQNQMDKIEQTNKK